jgi:uncharacterized RDD family membrane protein YckC
MSHHAATPSAGFGGGLVTGDAVVVELRLAKLPSRSLAFFIDLTLQLLLLLAVTFLLSSVAGSVDPTLGYVLFFVGVLAVFLGYPVACESLTRGRTLGKLALGLRVVRDDGGAERFRHALVRGLMGLVELYLFFGFIAILTSLSSAEGKRVGDYLAGTVVVRERAPSSGAVLPSVPPGLAGWAATLDLSRLPDGLALDARQFLGRAGQLTPAARQQLAGALAHDIATVVTPAPPAGLPAELYVQTVVAERRRRALSTAAVPGPDGPTGADPTSADPAPQPVVDPAPPRPSPGLAPPD